MTKLPPSWKGGIGRFDLDIEPPGGAVFDPSTAANCRVLEISTEMTDHDFGTDDDTEYVITVKNASNYYLALNIEVCITLAPEVLQDNTMPDGNCLIELIPNEQIIECLKPQSTKALHYRAITRGVKADCYEIDVKLNYDVVYWDGRPACQHRKFLLPVGVSPTGIIRAGTRSLRSKHTIDQDKENDHE
ncbi:MAG: hypothetical protein MJE77_06260 [Proteobacteria bacterium]|nr:hypothetical protein [Pseudomonadota bacterium]